MSSSEELHVSSSSEQEIKHKNTVLLQWVCKQAASQQTSLVVVFKSITLYNCKSKHHWKKNTWGVAEFTGEDMMPLTEQAV